MSAEQLERVRLEVEKCPQVNIIRPSDLLFLPRILRTVLNRAYRDGRISITELALGLELDTTEARTIAGLLVEKGYLQLPTAKSSFYKARFGTQANRSGRSPLDKL